MTTTLEYSIVMEQVHPEVELYYPVIARIIYVDGKETVRGYPEFVEISETSPRIISEYNTKFSEVMEAAAAHLQNKTSFTMESYWYGVLVNRAAQYFTDNYREIDTNPAGKSSQFL